MLDLAGDGAGDVELGHHGLAGLAYLVRIRYPVGVHGAAGSAHGAAEYFGQLFEQGEVLLGAHAASARHDDIRFGDVDGIGELFDDIQQLRARRKSLFRVNLADYLGCAPGVYRGLLHDLVAHRSHLRPVVGGDDSGHDVAAEGRAGLQQQPLFRVYI